MAITSSDAQALVTIFLYPEEARINLKVLGSLTKRELVKVCALQTARCTPKGNQIAMRQLLYLLNLRGLSFRPKRRSPNANTVLPNESEWLHPED